MSTAALTYGEPGGVLFELESGLSPYYEGDTPAAHLEQSQ